MHAHSTANAGVGRPHWRSEMQEWCSDFRSFLGKPWKEAEAGDLFARIEALSILTELIADHEVSDTTAELAVYFCAFVDSQLHPDAGQLARLGRLAGELEQALAGSGPPADAGPAHDDPGSPLFRVIYVRDPSKHDPALAAALAQERIEVASVDSVDEALFALDHILPDAVLLHSDFVGDLQRLAQSGRRHGAGIWRRVLWAAAHMPSDLRTRLQARRGGVDLLLDDDADDAAAALLHALLRRREEAYRVLVVEDDRGHAAFCESLLRHQGFEVDLASSAERALEVIEQRSPDLVLLDINLPDMTGIEFAQLVREQGSLSHVPIVFLTGEEDLDCRAEAIAVGGDDFLSKPVRPRHLLANVNSRIGRARSLAMSAPAERPEEGLTQRLDRVRFIESLERLRRESEECAVIVAYALDGVAGIAEELGFVRAGNLALQIAQAIEGECGGLGKTCGIGEFSRLALLRGGTEVQLRERAEGLRQRLGARGWVSAADPRRLGFSAGVVRFDGSPAHGDRIIAQAISLIDEARRRGGSQLAFLDLR